MTETREPTLDLAAAIEVLRNVRADFNLLPSEDRMLLEIERALPGFLEDRERLNALKIPEVLGDIFYRGFNDVREAIDAARKSRARGEDSRG